MDLVIEQATLHDAEALAAFSRKSFDETFSSFNSRENMDKVLAMFTSTIMASELQDPDNVFFLAKSNDQIEGYTKLSKAASPPGLAGTRSLEMCRLYVDKSAIGSGLGKSLMQNALEYAANQWFDVVWLGVWEHNIRALSFYKKWGFERFGEHIFMLGDDPQTDWLMKKVL